MLTLLVPLFLLQNPPKPPNQYTTHSHTKPPLTPPTTTHNHPTNILKSAFVAKSSPDPNGTTHSTPPQLVRNPHLQTSCMSRVLGFRTRIEKEHLFAAERQRKKNQNAANTRHERNGRFCNVWRCSARSAKPVYTLWPSVFVPRVRGNRPLRPSQTPDTKWRRSRSEPQDARNHLFPGAGRVPLHFQPGCAPCGTGRGRSSNGPLSVPGATGHAQLSGGGGSTRRHSHGLLGARGALSGRVLGNVEGREARRSVAIESGH